MIKNSLHCQLSENSYCGKISLTIDTDELNVADNPKELCYLLLLFGNPNLRTIVKESYQKQSLSSSKHEQFGNYCCVV